MPDTKLYVFTIPKAGTYFLAELLTRLGWRNSEMHVAESHYLLDKGEDLEALARNPIKVLHESQFNATLAMIEPGQLCYGHMNPMHFYGPHRTDFAVVGGRRHLRDVLVAEFIDFRFRRQDELVTWVGRKAVADDHQAFLLYLEHQGPVIAHIAATYIAYRDLRSAAYYNRAAKMPAYVDLSFEALMGPFPQAELTKLGRALGLPHREEALMDVLQQAKASDNKTKTVGETLPFDRDRLWDDPRTLELYEQLGMPELSARLGYPL